MLVAQDQGSALEESLITQTDLVDELTGAEKKLFDQVKQQQKEQAALDKAIENAIAEEIAASRALASESTGEKPPKPPLVEASGFAGNRGRLPWPVKGEITKPFGRQPHPGVPSVTINNGGIDIDGGRGARVQAVFAGKIISIREIPGYRNTIMVRHGNYYTIYSNLEKVLVKVGEEIESRATVGYTSRGGDPLHFELWKGRDRQDPSRWLN